MSNRKGIRKLSFLGFGTGLGGDNHGPGGAAASGSEVVQLDDEMEDVFAQAEAERFRVSELLLGSTDAVLRKQTESGHDQHRKRSYPHAHVPLKIRGARRYSGPSHAPASVPLLESEPAPASAGDVGETAVASPPLLSPGNGTVLEEDPHILSSGSDPPSRAQSPTGSLGNPEEKRVQFLQKKIEVDDVEALKKKRKSRRSYQQHRGARKYSLQEEPQWKREGRRVSVQPEDEALNEADLEELDSHRSDDPRGLRRPKIQRPLSGTAFVRIGRKGGNDNLQTLLTPTTIRKMYDHSPHAVFVQLDELVGTGDEKEWKETARWIKYEEDLEEGSDRWGRPHVASLSFHSLLNLRRCLQSGVVLLDLDEKDLTGVAYRITEQMVIDELIAESDKATVMRSLLMRHKHVNENDRGWFVKKHSSYTSLQWMWEHAGAKGRRSTVAVGRCSVCSTTGPVSPPRVCRRHSENIINLTEQEKNKTKMLHSENETNGSPGFHRVEDGSTRIDMKEETYMSTSQEDLKRAHNETILKRIPEGAEATTVLVGSVGFLSHPTIAFVRLAQGIYMPTITEVTIPVRFMFVLLGPSTADLDYHEVGRSISTLMSNNSFHQIAYKAEGRKDLLSAINEFLDDSIVLPPGNWESQALLPIEELKAKSEMIMKRKRDALLKQKKAIEDRKPVEEKTKEEFIVADKDDPKKQLPFDPLARTNRLFGGVINDIKRRYPLYVSDFTSGFNGQCFAAAIFMYFAALCSAITFGGLMADKTNNLMGTSETLLSTSITGILFALLSAQPMMVVGATGPLLLFDQSLLLICASMEIDFLTMRLYIGFWIAIISTVVAMVEGSVLAKQFTRFTEDIFSSLINAIFIIEALTKLHAVYIIHSIMSDYCMDNLSTAALFSGITPSSAALDNSTNGLMMMDDPGSIVTSLIMNSTSMEPILQEVRADMDSEDITKQPNTALFCTVLTLGTFIIAYFLRIFRNSKFLGRSARRALGDFGVPIAIIIMVFLDSMVPQVYTEKLKVPEGLTPSDPTQRNWFVSFIGSSDKPFPVWGMFAAAVPALMAYIIIFMETHIAELIVDKPERNLRKGSGFHLDIVVISYLNIICGLIGAPFVCVATVRSLSHVSALTIMSVTHAPGDKPHIVEVKEQRLSALIVAILVGASVSMAFLLSLVPMAVLFGIFLYMGISSMTGIQMFERAVLFIVPVKHHPPVAYVKRVPTWKMHIYTFIQLGCLVLLFWIKYTSFSLAFPFLLIMLIPLRWQLKHFFTPMELHALDGKQPELDLEDEPDFYEESTLPG